ncbi:MAG: hypothetical protein J6X30_02180 [Clostridia bacterium]|nr:hypothetical protein [Clostridia bacterium]
MDKAHFTKAYDLRASDFDARCRLKPGALFDLLQDAAGQHAMRLGAGYSDMLKKNLLWVVVRQKVVILRAPEMYETVRVTTWPREAKRLDFQREYRVESENGEEIARGSSQWALIDAQTRRVKLVHGVFDLDRYDETPGLGEKLTRLPDFEAGENVAAAPIYTDLDSNGHVNNTRYADLAYSAVPEQARREYKSVQIDFHKEVHLGDTVLLSHYTDGDRTLVKGECGTERMFTCAFEWRDREP